MLCVSSSVFFPYSTVGWSLIVAVVGHTRLILIGSKIPIPYPNLEHFLTIFFFMTIICLGFLHFILVWSA